MANTMIVGNTRIHNISSLTPEEVRVYSGLNLELFENIRIDRENIITDLREDAFADLPARFAIVHRRGKYVVVDLHRMKLYCDLCDLLPSTLNSIVAYSNNRVELEERAAELNAPPCALRGELKGRLFEAPIIRYERGAYDMEGKDWEFGTLRCPECGTEFVSVFSKYYRHP